MARNATEITAYDGMNIMLVLIMYYLLICYFTK